MLLDEHSSLRRSLVRYRHCSAKARGLKLQRYQDGPTVFVREGYPHESAMALNTVPAKPKLLMLAGFSHSCRRTSSKKKKSPSVKRDSNDGHAQD